MVRNTMKALITLTPVQSKRLIAEGIIKHPDIQKALKKGKILMCRGTTNAYILEKLLNKPIEKNRYVAGQIVPNVGLTGCPADDRLPEILFVNGTPEEISLLQEAVEKMGKGDVIIKGGNALDLDGNVGVLMAHPLGGTVGVICGPALARGIRIMIPIGLEKMIAGDVHEYALELGREEVDLAMGNKVGLFPIPGIVVTELDSLELLFNVSATHVASGGVGGAEGCAVILIEGTKEDVEETFNFTRTLQREKPFQPRL